MFTRAIFLFSLLFSTVKYIHKALENEDIGRYRKRWSKKGASKNTGEVTVLPIAPLTTEEEGDRLHLERKVERAFYEAGMALMQLRDRRLYRTTHATFEEYCRDRFDYVRRRSYQLIDAAKIYNNLSEKCEQIVHILPTREGQVRSMSQLNAEEQVIAWETAVEEAGGKVPTGKIVKDVVQRIKDNERLPISLEVGEVCQIMARDNPELRGKSGCWCIVSEVYEFSCLVATWDSEYTLRPEHLKSLEYSPDECRQMENLGIRMTLLHQTGKLDEAALWILNGLAKLLTPYLTILEEKLLALLESEYGTVGENSGSD